jgi:hypothetical protein
MDKFIGMTCGKQTISRNLEGRNHLEILGVVKGILKLMLHKSATNAID